MHKLKMLVDCEIGEQQFKANDIVEVDAETALELLESKKAEKAAAVQSTPAPAPGISIEDATQLVSKAVEGAIEKSLLKRYNTVMHRRGTAVVEVRDGVCQGCHMSLAPQLAIQVERGESIQSCRQCNRLLFVPEAEEEGEESQAS